VNGGWAPLLKKNLSEPGSDKGVALSENDSIVVLFVTLSVERAVSFADRQIALFAAFLALGAAGDRDINRKREFRVIDPLKLGVTAEIHYLFT
jgi:hypothetical protein